MANSASEMETDVAASNGVTHVIDAVLLPPLDASDNLDDVARIWGYLIESLLLCYYIIWILSNEYDINF